VAALLWWGVLPPIYDGIGVPALPIIASLLAILLATMAPLIADATVIGKNPIRSAESFELAFESCALDGRRKILDLAIDRDEVRERPRSLKRQERAPPEASGIS